ncbi:hypothetical protein RRG08_044214 [Elysia crispata]|uniref:PB1 domain-containing protein n=1 Tax=Elysia crispata TaxID=231223 RepID=A0AAE0XWW8_9GAST|nr:hypothetical protein RRG08_044214 [Elysia crispata]
MENIIGCILHMRVGSTLTSLSRVCMSVQQQWSPPGGLSIQISHTRQPGVDFGADDSDLSDVVASIQKNLEKGLKMGNKRARQVALHNLQKRSELKVKCEFGGEKRVLSVPRPVLYHDLVRRLQEMYQMLINVFYTQCNGEIYIPMRSQQDLDAAVQLVDQNEHLTSLRLYLTPALSGVVGGGGGSDPAGHGSVQAGATGYPSPSVSRHTVKGSSPPMSGLSNILGMPWLEWAVAADAHTYSCAHNVALLPASFPISRQISSLSGLARSPFKFRESFSEDLHLDLEQRLLRLD